jgi:hypothetical protein
VEQESKRMGQSMSEVKEKSLHKTSDKLAHIHDGDMLITRAQGGRTERGPARVHRGARKGQVIVLVPSKWEKYASLGVMVVMEGRNIIGVIHDGVEMLFEEARV